MVEIYNIYPRELHLNEANSSGMPELIYRYLITTTKVYDKRDDFNFDIVNFLISDDDVMSWIFCLVAFSEHFYVWRLCDYYWPSTIDEKISQHRVHECQLECLKRKEIREAHERDTG